MTNLIIKLIGNTLNLLSYISRRSASKIALNLFATPRKGRLTESQKTFLNTSKTTQLKYKDLVIVTYQWEAKGQIILLAHGWESNSERWKELIRFLKKKNYNIIALDAPAHGASSGKQFNAILYSECINVVVNHFKPQIIIGHSVGGMAAAFFQHKYKNKALEKLILLGAPSELTGVFRRYVHLMGYNECIENGLNELVLERFNNKPEYFSLANFSKSIPTKTLIIHDVHDKIVPFRDAKLIQKHHQNVTLISTKGFGHGLRRKAVNRDILDFIAS